MKAEIGSNEAQQRLDKFLRKWLKDVPLSAIYKAIRKGDVRVNGKKAKEKYTLEEGDMVEVTYISSADTKKKLNFQKVEATKFSKLKITYEDENMILVEKWPGILVHSDKKNGEDTLTDYILSYLYDKGDYIPEKELTFTPAPCNRLDRNTSGIVIFGKNYESLKLLNEIIIKVAPINEFGKIGEDLFVYFFSREGLVKKTSLREFLGEFNNQIAYKFKTPKDELVNVDINFENATVILVTKNGMGIKFLATAINPMGRVASGVTGISLKDDNKVIFGKVIPPSEDIDDKTLEAYNDYKKELTSNYEKLILESKQKEKAEVNIEDIKLQNRAGRGSSLMILVLEDYIRDVIIK